MDSTLKTSDKTHFCAHISCWQSAAASAAYL